MLWLLKSVALATLPAALADTQIIARAPSLLESLAPYPQDLGVRASGPQTRHYNFTVARESRAPDGFNHSLILVNGEFPGPAIEANLGDTISVTVTNAIHSPEEGTAIHWHGLPQRETQWADGVPFITQCPIAPGSSFTYVFKAEVAGSSWWHAHLSAQYSLGVFGAIIINPSEEIAEYDVDLGPIFINDWMHIDYISYLLPAYAFPPTFLPFDNNLINGRNPFDCSLETQGRACTDGAAFSKFKFETGKTHRLRLINSGVATTQKFWIDGHELTVIANDLVPVEPYTVKVATVGVGQRTDVLVKAIGKASDAVWMRSDADGPCSNITFAQASAKAIVFYPDADEETKPTSEPYTWESHDCTNDPLETTKPVEKKAVPEPDITRTVNITYAFNETGTGVFFVDGSSFVANFNESLLLDATKNITSYPDHPHYNVYNYGSARHVRLIFSTDFPQMHVMHLHGHADFQVLAEGMGEWDGKIVNEDNPQRRDSAQMRMGFPGNPSHLVIQYEADNPGVWSLHCHLFVHTSMGLYMNIQENPGEIKKEGLEKTIEQTCKPWREFSAKNPQGQIDSGLRKRKFEEDAKLLGVSVEVLERFAI